MEKTLSETKEELIKRNEHIKNSIENQLTMLKGDAAKIGKIALIAGGAILVAYLIAKGKKNQKNKVVNLDGKKYALSAADSEPLIVKEIRKYMIIFLAALAKQKLASYLQKINKNNSLEANTPKAPTLQDRWS